MVNVDKLSAKYGQTTTLTLARVKKLIGHTVPLVRINSLGVRGLRFHVAEIEEKTGVITLMEEKSGDKEKVTLSEISLSPRKSYGEGPHSFPAGFQFVLGPFSGRGEGDTFPPDVYEEDSPVFQVTLKFKNYGHGGEWYYMSMGTFPSGVDANTYALAMQQIDGASDRLYIVRTPRGLLL